MATISSKPNFGNPALTHKFDAITARIRELAPVLVAYSGGVDSTLVLKIGAMAVGDDCIGVTAQSESLADDEFEEAVRIAGDHGMRQELIRYSELAIENYADNPVNRCYLCKHELYTRLGDLAKQFNVNAVLDGTNGRGDEAKASVGDGQPVPATAADHRAVPDVAVDGVFALVRGHDEHARSGEALAA